MSNHEIEQHPEFIAAEAARNKAFAAKVAAWCHDMAAYPAADAEYRAACKAANAVRQRLGWRGLNDRLLEAIFGGGVAP